MHLSCERDALSHALAICANLCRAFPETFHVTLDARTPAEGSSGSMDVLLWGALSGIGVLANVPAEIAEAGSVTVPTRMSASALATMPRGQIRLSSVLIANPDSVPDAEQIKPLKGGPALQIEGISGTGATQRTRLRLCTPISEHAVSPALADWQASGIPLATLAPNVLREALEPCLLLAKKRENALEETPDMDHALVLFRFDPHALSCTATTRSAVTHSTLPCVRSSEDAPSTHALVDERMLRWVLTALKGETHPVTLVLVPQEAPATLLLFSLPHLTLVCRGKTAPIPLVWEQRIGAPSTHALLLSRAALVKALDFLSAARAGDADRGVLASVVNHRLWLQWDPHAQADHAAMCQLPIINTVADTSPVFIHLQHMRRIIRLLKGPAICLAIGTVMIRQKKGGNVEPAPIGFVRFSKPADATTQVMLAVDECPSSPPPRAELDAARPSGILEEGEKGASFAAV